MSMTLAWPVEVMVTLQYAGSTLTRLALPEEGHRPAPSNQSIRLKVFWTYSDHAHCYASQPIVTAREGRAPHTAIMITGAVTFFSSFRSSDLSQSI
jgi:hypothetical protein